MRSLKPALLAAALALPACNSARDPAAAYQAFHGAVRAHEYRKALDYLSMESRAHLIKQATEGFALSEPKQPEEPLIMLFMGAFGPPEELKKVSVERAEGGRATLSVETPKGVSQVRMVDEGGRWRLDLQLP